MAAPRAVMPFLSRLLCRLHSAPVRPLCSGRHRVNTLREEEKEQQPAAPAGDMGGEKNLLKQFPAPKNLLHCIISQSLRKSRIHDSLTYIHSGSGNHHRVTLRLKWPKLIEVEGYGPKKIDAERQAAAMACKILQDLGLFGPNNPEAAKSVSSRTRSRVSHASRDITMEMSDEDVKAKLALSVFPNPKNLLSSVIQVATSSSSLKDFMRYQRVGGRKKTSHLTLQWPESMSFVATGQRWNEAERKAAALACQRLKDLGLLDQHNQPLTNMMYNMPSVKKLRKQQSQAKTFQVPEHLLQRIEDYFYQFPLEPITESSNGECYDEFMESSDESCMLSEFSDPITSKPYTPLSEAEAFHISRSLEERWDSSISLQDLPADHHHQVILSAIKENQVVVIAGDTGCGKTTRIPRYILEDAILRGHGAHCNMLITQPRRISAVSVAHRVGQELGPSLRGNAGYQVRLESNLPPRGGALLFCTVGVLLRKLQANPGLEGVSHVVVDEVHERDVNTDFLLILLKQVLDVNRDIKIILMSATGDNERISRYFKKCPIVRVPGFMYPVKAHFLNDILPMLGKKSYQTPKTPECVPNLDLISDLILHIDKHGSPGGILCFLPGWQEIRGVQEILQEQLAYRGGQHLILPVHSNIPLTNQQVIFERPSPGVRKIVLATNIAETSVTIDDIVHVVDSGMHKEQQYDLRTKVSCLETTWVSKSNVIQRRGRAGRCQPGFSYHLFTHEQHQAMPTFQVAEILRTPLENLVVQAKIHTPEMTAVSFLSQALESPNRHAIMDAVRFLQEIGVLDENEELTLLGQRIANISTDPSLAKVLVLASIFRCLHPLLVIVACLTRDPFQGGLLNRSELNKVKTMFSGQTCSDHLAFVRVYQSWKDVLTMGNRTSRDDFMEENMLSRSALRFIQGLITQFSSNVEDASLVHQANECTNRSSLCNQLSDQDELVKGILLAGLYPKLIQVRRGCVVRGKFRPNSLFYKTKSGPVLLHKSTVNRDMKNFSMPWLTYFQAVKSTGAVFVRDSSMVHPLAILLLTDSSTTVRDNGGQMMVALSDTDLLKLESDHRTIALICDLRQALFQMVERNLQDQRPPLSSPEKAQYTQLLSILVDLLNGTSQCFTDGTEATAEE